MGPGGCDVGHQEEGAARPHVAHALRVELRDRRVAPVAVRRRHLRHAVLRARQRRERAVLRDDRGARDDGLLVQGELTGEVRRPHDVAHPPPRHGVRLREREDGDHALRAAQGGGRDVPALEDELVVALVRDDPEVVPLRDGQERAQAVGRLDRARRVAGRVDEDGPGARRDERGEPVGIQREAVRGLQRVPDGAGVQHVRHRRVVRPAGIGDEQLVPGVEHQEQAREQAAAAAGGDHDLLGVGLDAVAAAHLLGDRLAQRLDARSRGVAGRAAMGGRCGAVDDVRRRREVGVAADQHQRVLDRGRDLGHAADARVRGGGDAGRERRHLSAPAGRGRRTAARSGRAP